MTPYRILRTDFMGNHWIERTDTGKRRWLNDYGLGIMFGERQLEFWEGNN